MSANTNPTPISDTPKITLSRQCGTSEPSIRLRESHKEELIKRGISPDFAISAGIRSIEDNVAREMGFGAGIDSKIGLQGIGFPYYRPTGEIGTWRLKPDRPVLKSGEPAKYLSLIGSGSHIFLPHTTTSESLQDTKYNLIITEGEYKALSIAEAVGKVKTNRKTVVIGLNGVNGGWMNDSIVVETPDGKHEKKKTGNIHLTDAMKAIEWAKRTVYIAFDSDVGSRKQALEFKKSKRMGAWGAEFTLCDLLKSRGAEVRIVEIPSADGSKLGADDFIAKYGPNEFIKLLWNNWVAVRDVDKVIYQEEAQKRISVMEACDLRNRDLGRPPFVVGKLLPEQGTMMIAAAPKVGKSSLALNLACAVAKGDTFLARFPCAVGRVLYIQSEIPDWAMSERLKLMGDLPQGLLINNPGKMQLNWWEEDGYNKRRETGARERVMSLINIIREKQVKLVIFDPLRHFHSLNENNVDHVAHLFEVFRGIGRAAGCGVVIVHHHRKIGRSNVKYQGAEDMSGSGALYGEADTILSVYRITRADNTSRYKLIFDTRHSEQIEPLELHRLSGTESMLWDAETWDDNKSVKLTALDRIIDALQEGGLGPKDLMHTAKVSHSSLYRELSNLEGNGTVRKVNNIYYLASNLSDEE